MKGGLTGQKLVSTSFILALSYAWCVASASAVPQPRTVDLSAARAVRDVVALDLRRVVAADHERWVLTDVHPARDSGRAFYPAGFRDPATRQLTVPRGSRRIQVFDGRLTGTHLADPAVDFEAAYKWRVDLPLVRKGPRAHIDHLHYSPFERDGGSVICVWNGKATTEADLPACFLIPPGWQRWVVPAVAAMRATAGPATRPARPEQVLDAVARDNPLLALDAYRTLAYFPVPDTLPVAKRVMLRDHGLRQTMYAYCLLRRGAEAPDQIEAVIGEVVGEASGPDRVRGLIAALWIATLADEPKAVQELARSCIKRVAARGGTLGSIEVPPHW